MSEKVNLGKTLKDLRIKNNWTLKDVSEKTAISVSTLSKVERNQISLTFDKLVLLTEGLNLDFGALLSSKPTMEVTRRFKPSGRRSVSRATEGNAITTENYDHLYLHNSLLNRSFIPIVADIKAKTLEEFGDLVHHSGEEFAYVLEGAVILHTEFYEPIKLLKGDSVYFDSNMKHAYLAGNKDTSCKLLAICNANKEDLQNAFSGD